MSDNFIEEIKEEIRNDQIQRIWKDYGHVIIGTLVAIILATVVYLVWHSYQEKKLNEQTLAFESVLDAKASADKTADFASLKDNGSKGYKLLGAYLNAGEGSSLDAAKELSELAQQSDFKPFYHDLAALQAIMRKFDATNGAQLIEELKEFEAKGSVVQAQALELKGYAHMKLGNNQAAIEAFRAVIEQPSATQSMVVRSRALLEMLSGY